MKQTYGTISEPGVVLEVSDLTKIYRGAKAPALDLPRLTVRAGEIYAVVGRNGAGKTTLFNILAGAIRPSSGSISTSISRSDIGWCPQREVIDWTLTVRQNISMGLELRGGVRGAARRLALDGIAETLGLERFLDHPVEGLSGGELRRTQIARAMVGDPSLMLLDEPTTGLDPDGVGRLFDYLVGLRDIGRAAMISTHETSRFLPFCTSVIGIADGRIIAQMPVKEFMSILPESVDLWDAFLVREAAVREV